MIYGQKCELYDLICINYHKYANEWIFQKFEITIVFYTLHLTMHANFRGDRRWNGRDLRGGQIDPPPPSKNLVWNSPVKIGLKRDSLILSPGLSHLKDPRLEETPSDLHLHLLLVQSHLRSSWIDLTTPRRSLQQTLDHSLWSNLPGGHTTKASSRFRRVSRPLRIIFRTSSEDWRKLPCDSSK